MTSRFGQLAYTSFDAVGTAGGWQVKETSGDLTATETQSLIAGVHTVFRQVGQVPDFPTSDQLEQGPRRLAYRHLGDGAGYWHTFPAGSDSTGRPGNVFAHVLLDRAPDTHPRHRAIQRWRSPHWLQPYGAAAVARAQLPWALPELGSAVTKDSVVAFALDTATWRLATLFALLDAVAAALAGGAPVVLGVQFSGRGGPVDRPGEFPDVAGYRGGVELFHLRSCRAACPAQRPGASARCPSRTSRPSSRAWW